MNNKNTAFHETKLTKVPCQFVRQMHPSWSIAEELCLFHQSFSDNIRVTQNDYGVKPEIQAENFTVAPPEEIQLVGYTWFMFHGLTPNSKHLPTYLCFTQNGNFCANDFNDIHKIIVENNQWIFHHIAQWCGKWYSKRPIEFWTFHWDVVGIYFQMFAVCERGVLGVKYTLHCILWSRIKRLTKTDRRVFMWERELRLVI